MAAELELATDSQHRFQLCRVCRVSASNYVSRRLPRTSTSTIAGRNNSNTAISGCPFVMTAHCIRGPFSSWGFLWLLSSSTSFLCWLSCVPKGGGEGLAIATSDWSPRHARLTTRNARVYGLGVCLSTRRRCITSLHLAAFFFLLPFHFLRMFLVRFLVVFALLLLCRLPLCAGIATRGSPFV